MRKDTEHLTVGDGGETVFILKAPARARARDGVEKNLRVGYGTTHKARGILEKENRLAVFFAKGRQGTRARPE